MNVKTLKELIEIEFDRSETISHFKSGVFRLIDIYIEDLKLNLNITKWNKSEEILPERGKNVLVRYPDGRFKVMFIPSNGNIDEGWYPGGTPIGNSYWCELPEFK